MLRLGMSCYDGTNRRVVCEVDGGSREVETRRCGDLGEEGATSSLSTLLQLPEL